MVPILTHNKCAIWGATLGAVLIVWQNGKGGDQVFRSINCQLTNCRNLGSFFAISKEITL